MVNARFLLAQVGALCCAVSSAARLLVGRPRCGRPTDTCNQTDTLRCAAPCPLSQFDKLDSASGHKALKYGETDFGKALAKEVGCFGAGGWGAFLELAVPLPVPPPARPPRRRRCLQVRPPVPATQSCPHWH